jgi:hypothetical protein
MIAVKEDAEERHVAKVVAADDSALRARKAEVGAGEA